MEYHQNHTDKLAKWLSGNLNPQEKEKLEREESLDDLKVVLDDIDQWSLPAFHTEKNLSILKRKIKEKKHGPKSIYMFPATYRIAATMVLIIGAWFAYKYYSVLGQVILETGVAESIAHNLPDGSIVQLDALSSLAYNESDWPEGRDIEIFGRAYLKVEKGSKFKVITENGTVEVLGTQFEVISSPEKFNVYCFEGRVKVTVTKVDEILNMGEGVIFANNQLQKVTIDTSQPDWTQGYSRFENVKLDHVIDELKKYYAIQIALPKEYSHLKFSGKVTHADLSMALKSIFDPLEIPYTLTLDGQVIFN